MTLKTFYSTLLLATSSACLISLVSAQPDAMTVNADTPETDVKKDLNPFALRGDKNLPSVFQADNLDYNEKEQVVTATGNVYIAQGPKLLRADKVQHFQIQDKVIAEGNVWIKDEDDNYSFAQFAELTNQMNDGFIKNIKMLMTEDVRISGNHSKRYNGEKMILWQGVYSPCPVCKATPESSPLWQLKADKIIHSKEDQTLTFNHAWMEFSGIPVAYTPYFYMPDPTVKRKTGILTPDISLSGKNLGPYVCLPLFIVTGKNHDITLYPTITSKQGAILGAEFNHRLVDGKYSIDGSYAGNTHSDDPKKGDPAHYRKPKKNRWHIFFNGRYDINDETVFKIEVRRTSDLVYLKKFPVLYGTGTKMTDVQGTLRSYASIENFRQTSYGIIKGYGFQANDQKYTPVILPTTTFLYETMPGIFNETWHFDANLLNLYRDEGIATKFGEKMIRGSLAGGVQVPYVSPFGDIWKLKADVRGDAYHIENFKTHELAKAKDFNPKRLFPQASLTWRYPLVNYMDCHQWIIEPAAMAVSAPHGLNKIDIPDEDSPLVVVEPTNLFSMNRFYGYDKVDSGHRFVYGTHSRHYFTQGRKVFVFFGQSIRLDRHQVLPKRLSGEDRNASNYVASVVLVPVNWFEARSRLMFNRKNWTIEIAESSGAIKTPWIIGTVGHVYFDQKMTASKQRVSQINWTLATPQFYKWTASYNESFNAGDRRIARRSHEKRPRVLERTVAIAYNHECLITTVSVVHTGYRDRDLKPDTKVMLQLNFKNLGTISTGQISTDQLQFLGQADRTSND